MKKPIDCPDCNSKCIEVGKPIYPKEIWDHKPNDKRNFHEYRYACNKCKKEWLHDTLFNRISEIPEDSEYVYDFVNKTFHKRV